jgi:hypothetical protein
MLRFWPFSPYKKIEFEAFLSNLSNCNFGCWVVYARALGVSRQTMYRWRKHPLFRQALIEAVDYNLKEMERVGKHDWKMWREKIRMI